MQNTIELNDFSNWKKFDSKKILPDKMSNYNFKRRNSLLFNILTNYMSIQPNVVESLF